VLFLLIVLNYVLTSGGQRYYFEYRYRRHFANIVSRDIEMKNNIDMAISINSQCIVFEGRGNPRKRCIYI
jgi:hypothetical protein